MQAQKALQTKTITGQARQTCTMDVFPATAAAIMQAAQALRRGDLVAFPTETVYGLGANARDARAVAAIFAAKQRPRFNPLIVHVLDVPAAQRLAMLEGGAERLANAFWPGPLSLVAPMRADAGLCDLVTAGLDTVALRVPDHPVARALLDVSRLPIAAPSANVSGRLSPSRASHVAADLAHVPGMILDGGACPGGLESTIVGFGADGPVLLRPGGLAREEIEAVLGARLGAPAASPRPLSPGMSLSHYAPRTPVRINATELHDDEVMLGFGRHTPPPGRGLNLSASGDLREAAANFFAYLRELDRTGASTIAVAPIPRAGLGEAINDRLARASADDTGLSPAASSD